MIKVGQFLSARLDLFPREVTDELSSLQDEVTPADAAAVRALAETELGGSLGELLSDFDDVPVAAASLGQVHRARLNTEEANEVGFVDVVVKIQRPGIAAVVDTDLRALRRIARWMSRIRVVSDRADVPALVEEFATSSRFELDYVHEANNAERFRRNFEGDPRVHVPAVVWEHTTKHVLVLEDVTGIKINDVDALQAAGIDPHDVAEVVAGAMLDQFFVDGFFHADPHPGNIFVLPNQAYGSAERSENAEDLDNSRPWTIAFIDFGMMGEVPDNLREGMTELLLAANMHDGRRIVAGMQSVGIIVPGSDTRSLEHAMSEVFSRFGGLSASSLKNIDPQALADFAERFERVMRATPFQMPENFLLVIRAVSLLAGLCASLDADYNLWAAVGPYASVLLKDGDATKRIFNEVKSTLTTVTRLPGQLDHVLGLAENGQLEVEVPDTDVWLRRLEAVARRLVAAVVFAGLLVSGAILQHSYSTLSWWLMAASVPALLYALFARQRH